MNAQINVFNSLKLYIYNINQSIYEYHHRTQK
jgi:hypothetical protein